jgi:AraC-like DNA-binding protein
VNESALPLPGQRAVLSRMTEVLFVEVLRSWINSLRPGEGGWLSALGDPQIGEALQLIHERPDQSWTLQKLGRRVGLGRSAFSARFTKLIGQPGEPVPDRTPDGGCGYFTRIRRRADRRGGRSSGLQTSSAFSRLFHRHRGMSPGPVPRCPEAGIRFLLFSVSR